MKNFGDFHLPDLNDSEFIARVKEEQRKRFEAQKRDENEFSYWFPQIVKLDGKGLTKDGPKIRVPESVILPLTFDWYDWLQSDSYKPEKIKEFNEYLKSELAKWEFNANRDLFVKSGLFSDKFCFHHPFLKNGESSEELGQHVLDLCYGSMLVGCPLSKDIIVREFVKTSYERPSIYDGMKLNTEFRLFYDFDTKQVITTVNHWDYDTMVSNLHDGVQLGPDGESYCYDKTTFLSCGKEIEADFDEKRSELEKLAAAFLKNVAGLFGKWSVDFMWDGTDYVLIDMAKAESSAYYDKMLAAQKMEGYIC